MICPICKTRWADFPEKDFKFVDPHGKIKLFFSRITFNLVKRNGFYPKHDEAGFNRGIAYGSNKINCCFTCLDITDTNVIVLGNDMERWVAKTKEMIAKGEIE